MTVRTRAKGVVGGLLGFVLAAGLTGFGPAPQALAAVPSVQEVPGTVTSDVLPTAQIDGVAWDQAIVGNTVYVGGKFTSARPSGSPSGENESPRTNLMSYNLKTGVMTNWAPKVNGEVRVVTASPDGSRIYVGGAFNTVEGKNRNFVAAFNTSDGSLVSKFAPVAGANVFAIAATDTSVYLGGWFNSMNGVARRSLAAVSASDGSLLAWAPTTDGTVYGLGLTSSGDRVVVGGNFAKVNGADMKSMASVSAADGAAYPFEASKVIKNSGAHAAIGSLKVIDDQVFATGWSYGTGNFEGTVVADPYSGAIQNLSDCHGDTYDSTLLNGVVYSVSHHHNCSNQGGFPEIRPSYFGADGFTLEAKGTLATNTQGGYANFAGQPAGAMVNWWNVWSTGNITGMTQAGWTAESAGEYLLIGGEFTAINGEPQQGLVRFGTRKVVASPKVGPAGLRAESVPTLVPVGGTTIKGTFQTSFDRDGGTLTYKVIRDDRGTKDPVATLTADSTPWDRPSLTFVDNNVIPGWSYTYYVQVIDSDGNSKNCDPATAIASGTPDPYASSVLSSGPSHFWRLDQGRREQTSPDAAGTAALSLLDGVAGGAAGALAVGDNTASKFDGTSTGTAGTTVKELAPDAFSIETWFKTTSSSGGKLVGFGDSSLGRSSAYDRHLYLNDAGHLSFGVDPGSAKTITTEESYRDGRWHHAVATLSGEGMRLFVDGGLKASDSATTSSPAYSGYWRVGGDSLAGRPDAGSSAYFDGTLDEVAVYPTALTATQVAANYNAGTSATPSTPPVAAFEATVTDLDVTFDAADSTSENGRIVSHGWEFGDGSRARGATASHRYAQPGTFTVKLTVVDNLGASSSTSKTVTVAAADDDGGDLLAKDTFSRTGSRWGTAAIGGVWTESGSTYFSTDGSLGVISLPRAGAGPLATLASVKGGDVSITTDVALDKLPKGGNYLYQLRARVNGDSYYKLTLRIEPSGAIWLANATVVDGKETELASNRLGDFGYKAGQRLNLRFDVHGSAPTILEGKVWAAGTSEPETATVFSTERAEELQGDGAVGICAYVGPEVTSIPLTATVDRYLASTWTQINFDPVAKFTASDDGGKVTFDASESSDRNGFIKFYDWDFGDRSTGEGKKVSHVYAQSGTYLVKLTVTDDQGASASVVKQVTVNKVNQLPSAAFRVTKSGLAVEVDASDSKDPDGSLVAYAWDFGDGRSGTGKTHSHTYAKAGTYPITLVVTDNSGADSEVARQSITVKDDDPAVVAADAFERATASGWGVADVGGAWKLNSGRNFSSDGANGRVLVTPGSTLKATLDSVSAKDVLVVTEFDLAKLPVGGRYYYRVLTRVTDSGTYYLLTARVDASGKTTVFLSRVEGNGDTTLKSVALPKAFVPGAGMKVRFDVIGDSPTKLAAKLWSAKNAEPEAFTLIAEDSSPRLASAGAIGLSFYASASASDPITAKVADLMAKIPGGRPTPPQPDPAKPGPAEPVPSSPVPSSPAPSSPAPPSPTASSPVPGSPTATAPKHEQKPKKSRALAEDSFSRVTPEGWGRATKGGVWSVSPTSHYSTDGSNGVLTVSAGATPQAVLKSVSAKNVSIVTDFTLDQVSAQGRYAHQVIARVTGSSTYYAFRTEVEPGGKSLRLYLTRVVSGKEKVLARERIHFDHQPGERLQLRFDVSGDWRTSLSAMVWRADTAEPRRPAVTAKDFTRKLRRAGAVGVMSGQMPVASPLPYQVKVGSFVVNRYLPGWPTK